MFKNLEKNKDNLWYKEKYLKIALVALSSYKRTGDEKLKEYFEYFLQESKKYDIIKIYE